MVISIWRHQFGLACINSAYPSGDVGAYHTARSLQWLYQARYSLNGLSALSGVPKNTIHHWCNGGRPQTWQPLLLLARAVGLSRAEADGLLRAARHPTVVQLITRELDAHDRALLQVWTVNNAGNLPAQMDAFIGRETEVAAVAELLARSRLVTLTGVAGSGKTRLGYQTLENIAHTFAQGVHLVLLGPISNPDLVLSAIAEALKLKLSRNEPIEDRLKEHLSERETLLMLDNFEQIVEAATQIAALLWSAPKLKLLVTSRVRLRLRGEREYIIGPLDPPDPTAEFDVLRENPAVQLFADRAMFVRPEFELTRENAAAVGEICSMLDGPPLAIELAAARSKLFDPHELLRRFPSRLDLGSDGPVDATPKHRTLRDTLAWSYNLLDAEEQTLFRLMGVFVGGCSESCGGGLRGQ
ncbi:MAG: NB-ARC domain-containing protein [Chloroflexia bacterium]